MFDIFKDVSNEDLKTMYDDMLHSEEVGNRPRSLDSYYKKIQDICRMSQLGEAISLTDKLFYREIAKRYFDGLEGER